MPKNAIVFAGGFFAMALLAGSLYAAVQVAKRLANRSATPNVAAIPAEPMQNIPVVPIPTTHLVMAEVKPTGFDGKLKPFLGKFCTSCHNANDVAGGVDLTAYLNEAHARKDRKAWEMVAEVISAGNMPPKKSKAQPTKADRDLAVGYIENTLIKIDCTAPKDAGRVTLRRLNRAEYNNTIRDLCGVDFKPAEGFPSDDVGYGFDNIGDVLSLQPVLIEKYLAAADEILTKAIPVLDPIKSAKQRFGQQNLVVFPREAKTRGDKPKIAFTTEGSAALEKFNFPAEGEYIVRVKAWGTKIGDETARLVIRVDGKDLKDFRIEAAADKMTTVEFKTKIAAGERKVAAVFNNPFEDKKAADAALKFRTLGIDSIEIEGPIGGALPPLSDGAKFIFIELPKGSDDTAAAEKIIANFARRAYRRPVKPEEMTRLMKLFALAQGKKESFDKSLNLPLKAILVSPHFLFRVEDDAKLPATSRALNDFEFASRLSYFLWSTMPDEELFQLAAKGEVRKPSVLQAQIKRMLKDKKSVALTENFAGQWLMLRNIRTLTPDKETYPNWDEALRSSMIRETELFFEHIVKNDRKVTEFLDADYTFVNDRLAKHYGIAGVRGGEFQQVKLQSQQRGGLVSMASFLTVTSNPTRTSPVKRGKWVLDNLLGQPPPPPAPDVPQLEATPLKGTLRQQMEQHRANPSCAGCHAKLDPLGFGLENYDGIGGWRTTEKTDKIDSTGVLPDGKKFDGPAELRKVLLGKSDLFRRCLAEKLLTFALGRGLEYYDKCVLDELVTKLKSADDQFSALILAIAQSDPFTKRQSQRSE